VPPAAALPPVPPAAPPLPLPPVPVPRPWKALIMLPRGLALASGGADASVAARMRGSCGVARQGGTGHGRHNSRSMVLAASEQTAL
jgi:hypothetical protein